MIGLLDVKFLMMLGMIVLSLFILFLISRYLIIKKSHHLLEEKNKEIEKQKKMLAFSLERLKQAQGELVKLEQKNSVMAMAVTTSHEINQPLMVLQANIEMLEMLLPEELLSEKHKRYISNIRTSMAKIKQILDKFHTSEDIIFDEYAADEQMIVFKNKNKEQEVFTFSKEDKIPYSD